MIVNEISFVIQNIIQKFLSLISYFIILFFGIFEIILLTNEGRAVITFLIFNLQLFLSFNRIIFFFLFLNNARAREQGSRKKVGRDWAEKQKEEDNKPSPYEKRRAKTLSKSERNVLGVFAFLF